MSRITFTHMNAVVQGNLAGNYSKLSKLQEQLSSGKAITRPSDAPIQTTNDLELRSNLKAMGQYGRNLQDGRSYLGTIDSTLTNSTSLFQSVRELAIQGDNSTNTAVQRSYIGNEVRQVLLQMVGISNTTYKGDFVFSGKNTDIPPFQVMKGSESVDNVDNTGADVTDTFLTVAELNTPLSIFDRNSNDSSTPSGNPIVEKIIPGTLEIQGLDEGTDYKVDYVNGTITYLTNNAVAQAAGGGIDLTFDWIRRAEEDLSGDILRQIDDSVIAKVNVTADDVFGSNTETDTFEAIIKLLQGLHANEQNNISDSISEIDEVLERTLSAAAVIGSRANQMDGSMDRIGEKVIETTRLQSNIEDLDFAKAISDFTLHEAVYNASVQSAARVLQPTLSDFI